MKNKTFEKELPEGYREVKHINAKDVKLGLILNGVCVAVMLTVDVLALIPLLIKAVINAFSGDFAVDFTVEGTVIPVLAFCAAMIAYIVLHEIVHGIAYKALTGKKLTFGMSWSCAFCGVPNVYTYRRTALIALVSPLIVFTLILVPLTAVLFFVSPLCYFLSATLLGIHLGGCSGDIYCTFLLLFKFKDEKMLMRDTGPEQYFYLPEKN